MPTIDIGVDLGTTNSAVFYYSRGEYCAVNFNGRTLFPSCLCFDKNEVRYGAAAKLSFGQGRKNVVRNVKRLIGRYYNSKEVNDAKRYCGVTVVNKDNKPYLQIVQEGVTKDYSPSEIDSMLLKEMFNHVKKQTSCEIGRVLLTIPAHFDANQRTATLEAIIASGISEDRITIRNEPTAAAVAYGFTQNPDEQKVLVYDLGGGTFDVSILHVQGNVVNVLMHAGNNFLGGSNFDEIILNWMLDEYKEECGEDLLDSLDKSNKQKAMNALLQTCEEAKEQLSASTSYTISLPLFLNGEFDVDLDRDTLNELLDKSIKDTMEVVKKALRKANLTRDDIDRVILVGGSSKLKLVRDKVTEYFGEEKTKEVLNPDECVALGACMMLRNDIIVKDKTAFSLGTSLINEEVKCVIPVMESIPVTKTVRVTTTRDNQTEVVSAVCQSLCEVVGEIEPKANTTSLGQYNYTGFRSAPKGEVHFDTTFRYDGSNIVYITVQEVETGKYLLKDHRFSWET